MCFVRNFWVFPENRLAVMKAYQAMLFHFAIFYVLVKYVICMVFAMVLMYFRIGDGVKLLRNVIVFINFTIKYVYQNEWFMIWLERGASMRCGFYHVL